MKHAVIETPALNSRSEAPQRRFKFGDTGITTALGDAVARAVTSRPSPRQIEKQATPRRDQRAIAGYLGKTPGLTWSAPASTRVRKKTASAGLPRLQF
jgi:hypothetical protein